MDDKYEEEYYEEDEYIEPDYYDDNQEGEESLEEEAVDSDLDIFDARENYSHDDEEWTVVTQSFYEQYGAEIQASVKELSEQDVYEPYEDEEYDDSEREFKPKKKRKKKHYFLKFLAACAVIAIAVAIAFSSAFNIKEIKVVGAVNNPPDKIIKESGVKVGENIFKVRGSEVSKALKENSYLSSVDIDRELPGTLIIVVKERQEVSYISYGNSYVVLDGLGCVLRKVDKKPKLTQIMGVTIKEMDIGEIIKVKEEGSFDKNLEIIKAMKSNDLFFKKIQTGKAITRAYIKDNLLCKGEASILIKNIENGNLRMILEDLRKKHKGKGTIIFGDGDYCSFSPKVE